MAIDIGYAKSLPYETIRGLYKSYLQSIELGRNTIGTVVGDTFYLWNNGSKDLFWSTVESSSFEEDARSALHNALSKNSTGNVDKLLNGYVSNLRRFRTFVFENDIAVPEKNDATALKEFLLDIDCLNLLSEWTSSFNLFDILKISRAEIRHSNILSWLLNPNENHGLGDSILRGFIQYVVTSFSDEADVFDMLLMDCYDFSIQREWHNIDILAVSANEKFVLCIENKIGSGEHDNQLNRYRNLVDETFTGYRKKYIYLSPEGDESSDPENWCAMSYEEVMNIVDNARKRIKILPDAALLIDNYIETIRRDIVGDERLARICAEIYSKHQKALDLIFENRPDRLSQLKDMIYDWAMMMTEKGELTIVPDKCNKTYTRFKTSLMSEILPDAEEALSGWGTKNHYFYEIRNIDGKEFYIQLALSAKDIPSDLRIVCEKINKYYPSRQQKDNWLWRTPFTTKHSKVDEELSEENIFNQLSKRFEEVKSFEAKLKDHLASDEA